MLLYVGLLLSAIVIPVLGKDRSLDDLTDSVDPAWPLIRQWISEANRPVDIIPPPTDQRREKALQSLQVTTRSTMGAVVYESGGLLIDDGWVRVLGAGHSRLRRSLPEWNERCGLWGTGRGFLLIGDDVLGGLFAVNGGRLSNDAIGSILYFAPDSLEWESLDMGYTAFVYWLLSGNLEEFYEKYRWPGWRTDVKHLGGNVGYSFYPPLWAISAAFEARSRQEVPMIELWGIQQSLKSKLTGDSG
ncbi:MAG: DUF2625 family protein [Acidiferrobacterales bacterium]|nr:DUF2625 family protein [Acidiferrobacterales bacterium]